MSTPFFRFKQFTIWHDRCAMKVGTDGVLLGAWSPLPTPCERILDIGTGTGLIALMMAQRQSSAHIDAIDISQDCIQQAEENIASSPWANRIDCHLCALQQWHPIRPYDLIISNPPFFQNSLPNPDRERAQSRHTDSLSYQELCEGAKQCMTQDGYFCIILPSDAREQILSKALEVGLVAERITNVFPKPGKEIRRILICFRSNDCSSLNALQEDNFYIESAYSPRSEEYAEITKDFYL